MVIYRLLIIRPQHSGEVIHVPSRMVAQSLKNLFLLCVLAERILVFIVRGRVRFIA